jgi:hypothetical protein
MRKSIATLVLSLIVTFHHAAFVKAQTVSNEEATAIAKDAYVYAYPLVLTYLTAIQTTNFTEPTGVPTQAPVNQFSHALQLVPADYKAVVRPNNDTLYSTAVVDVGQEPVILSASDRPLFHAAYDEPVDGYLCRPRLSHDRTQYGSRIFACRTKVAGICSRGSGDHSEPNALFRYRRPHTDQQHR